MERTQNPKGGNFTRRVRAALGNPRAALYRYAATTGGKRFMEAVTVLPVSFHDKVRYKMVRDRRTLIGDFADKVKAKEYVERVVSAAYAVETLAVYEDADAIRDVDLPDEFVIKVSHASGGMVLVREDATPDAGLPEPGGPLHRYAVRREAFDVDLARQVFAAWLAEPFGARRGEWAYGVHKPRVLVEPLLRTTSGEPLRDVKFHVMNGRVVFFALITTRDGIRSISRYLRDGSPFEVSFRTYYGKYYPNTKPAPALPDTLDQMIEIAESLGSETDYLRVDILDLGERFLVGELTNYPASGQGRFHPVSFDRWLGRQWTLPQSYT